MNSSQSRPAAMSKSAPGAPDEKTRSARIVLWCSTAAFTLLFAVWLMFGVLGILIKKELDLSEWQFSWLTAVAILNGSIWRLTFGIAADRFGGKRVMSLLLLATAVPTFLVAFAHSYILFLALAFLVGIAGNSFSAGIAWNSIWADRKTQGLALGIFGAGNVGASVTKLIGPAMITLVPTAGLLGGIIPGGWRFVPVLYTALLLIMAAITWFLCPGDLYPGRGRSTRELLRPLAHLRVWRLGLYYVVTFGAYVALSGWLPHYYMDIYHLKLASAALLTALFIFPASLLRPFGGYLSDKFGPRVVMYAVFSLLTAVSLLLAMPGGTFTLDAGGRTWHLGIGVGVFTLLVFLVGVGMGIGKAAVYKYVPEYFPHDIGAVGGLVGALGGLGGFFLPPLFAAANKALGFPQATFAVFFLVVAASFIWLHITVLGIKRTEGIASGLASRANARPSATTPIGPLVSTQN